MYRNEESRLHHTLGGAAEPGSLTSERLDTCEQVPPHMWYWSGAATNQLNTGHVDGQRQEQSESGEGQPRVVALLRHAAAARSCRRVGRVRRRVVPTAVLLHRHRGVADVGHAVLLAVDGDRDPLEVRLDRHGLAGRQRLRSEGLASLVGRELHRQVDVAEVGDADLATGAGDREVGRLLRDLALLDRELGRGRGAVGARDGDGVVTRADLGRERSGRVVLDVLHRALVDDRVGTADGHDPVVADGLVGVVVGVRDHTAGSGGLVDVDTALRRHDDGGFSRLSLGCGAVPGVVVGHRGARVLARCRDRGHVGVGGVVAQRRQGAGARERVTHQERTAPGSARRRAAQSREVARHPGEGAGARRRLVGDADVHELLVARVGHGEGDRLVARGVEPLGRLVEVTGHRAVGRGPLLDVHVGVRLDAAELVLLLLGEVADLHPVGVVLDDRIAVLPLLLVGVPHRVGHEVPLAVEHAVAVGLVIDLVGDLRVGLGLAAGLQERLVALGRPRERLTTLLVRAGRVDVPGVLAVTDVERGLGGGQQVVAVALVEVAERDLLLGGVAPRGVAHDLALLAELDPGLTRGLGRPVGVGVRQGRAAAWQVVLPVRTGRDLLGHAVLDVLVGLGHLEQHVLALQVVVAGGVVGPGLEHRDVVERPLRERTALPGRRLVPLPVEGAEGAAGATLETLAHLALHLLLVLVLQLGVLDGLLVLELRDDAVRVAATGTGGAGVQRGHEERADAEQHGEDCDEDSSQGEAGHERPLSVG